jgi:hypothetical protein
MAPLAYLDYRKIKKSPRSDIEEVLRARSDWGVRALKCDFLASDSQGMMKYYDWLAETCAKHKQMLNWHGCTLPRGQRRRWPHMISYEAVKGAEWYKDFPHLKSTPPPTPTHNCTLPFTRNVVGPMDYMPVIFSGPAARPRRQTSNAHELALSVMFECGFQHWCDEPDSYRAIPAAISYLKKVPAAWDDTKFINGYPGQYACLARRKADDWFLAGIAAGDAHQVSVSLSFLTPGETYRLTLHTDGRGKDDIVTKKVEVTNETTLAVELSQDGGFCGHLTLQ